MKFKNLALTVLIYGFIVASSFAATWHTATEQTVAWDAVTTTEDGTVIPSAEITYEVFIRKQGSTEEISLGRTGETSHTLSLPSEGRWFFGVRAIRTVVVDPELGTTEEVSESRIVWSSEPAYDLGIQFWNKPSETTGLRIGS
jgi:hypothetical protein